MRAKILLIGKTGSGKTSIRKSLNGKFDENQSASDSIGHQGKELSVQEKEVTLQIWDIPGGEDLKTEMLAYYRSTHPDAFVLVIDATQPFDAVQIKAWINNAKDKQPNAVFYVAVNKYEDDLLHVDFKDQIAVKAKLKAEVPELSPLKDEAIIFCSAKNNENINELFEKIAQDHVTLKTRFINPLIKRLTEYMPWWKKKIAAIKAFFSFGLSEKKQSLAENLTEELKNLTDPSKFNEIVLQYEDKNRELILEEYSHTSPFFRGRYLAKSEDETSSFTAAVEGKSLQVKLNKGEFGQILAAYKETSPKLS